MDFDKSFNHVYKFSFTDNNLDPEMELSGKLFMRELFLNSQMNAKQMAPLKVMTYAIILATNPLWGGYLYKQFWDPESEFFDHPKFWHYTGPLTMVNLIFTMSNIGFMNAALIDADKKNMMMKRLS